MQAGREIKFRALGVDGDLHYFDIYDIVSPPDEDGVFYVRSNLGILIAVEEGTEQQFTGLRDKNGKEIYEGDIIRFDCVKGFYENQVAEVIKGIAEYAMAYNGEVLASLSDCHEESDRCDCEVIGNIYENPELLEVGN